MMTHRPPLSLCALRCVIDEPQIKEVKAECQMICVLISLSSEDSAEIFNQKQIA